MTLPSSIDASTTAWFLDVDGTLLDIASRPDRVIVPPGLVDDLRKLSTRTGGALALLSGRTIAALDLLFVPLRLPAAGCHGAQMRLKRGGAILSYGGVLPPKLRQRLEALAVSHNLLTEDKGGTLALHYRDLTRHEAALAALAAERPAIAAAGYEVLEGRQVMEIRRPGLHKGAALEAFMAVSPFTGRRPLFAGDDITDEDALRHLAEHNGIGIAVGSPRPGAGFTVDDPASFRRWLHRQAGA